MYTHVVHIENTKEFNVTNSIETYKGAPALPHPNATFPSHLIPIIPRSVCGVKNDEEAPENMKGPLILFSSGLDSTYLVHEALKTGNVHLLYVVGNFYDKKREMELTAREKIKQYFIDNPNSEYRILSDTILQFEMGDTYHAFNGVSLSQPAMWLFPAMCHYKSGLHTSVQIAYVKNDLIIPFLDNLKTAWDALTKTIKFRQIPLLFPVAHVDKKDSYNSLPVALRDLVWVCDTPMVDGNRNPVECKRCGPCRRRALYLNQ